MAKTSPILIYRIFHMNSGKYFVLVTVFKIAHILQSNIRCKGCFFDLYSEIQFAEPETTLTDYAKVLILSVPIKYSLHLFLLVFCKINSS